MGYTQENVVTAVIGQENGLTAVVWSYATDTLAVSTHVHLLHLYITCTAYGRRKNVVNQNHGCVQ